MKEKIRIAYAGSDTYNALTAGSRFCNDAARGGSTCSPRGFLGGALYNENWEPTDGCTFRDFSRPGIAIGGDKTECGSDSLLHHPAIAAAMDWKPDFLLLQLDAVPVAPPETYAADLVDLASRIRGILPACRLYLVGSLPAAGQDLSHAQNCAAALEKSCRQAGNLRFIDVTSALTPKEWADGQAARQEEKPLPPDLCWKLGQTLLFGFFEEAEQLVFPDKAASGKGTVVKVSPAAATDGLPPPCDPDQGFIRDLPEGWWPEQLERGRRIGKNCELIFVGDSITHWWTDTSHIDDTYSAAGKQAFRRFFGKYEGKTLNLGQASDTTADVLHRIREGALGAAPGTFAPRLVSILIGTNNIGNPNLQKQFGGPDNSRQLAQGILSVVQEVKRYCPGAKIVVTGVLPTRIPYDMTRSKLEYANHLVALQAAGLGFHFLDMASDMTNPDGSTIPELYNAAEGTAARLHLCEAGYERWAARLVEFLD